MLASGIFFAKYDTVDGESVRASSAQAVSADHWTAPLLLTVDPSLAWDPTSFGITKFDRSNVQAVAIDEDDDSCGPWHFVDDAGRADLNGWQIPVWPGREIELGVNLNCAGPTGAKLNWIDVLSIDFTDDDGNGRYTASFISPEIEDEVLVELAVTCGDNVTIYTGFLIPVDPATLVNAETGEPLRDGTIELWQRVPEAEGRQWTVWNAQAHGQINPQTTDADGHFSFITPAGAYGLTAQIDGFQPFRAGPLRLQGIFPSRNIALTPVQAGDKVVQVRIMEEGFDPPHLVVAPDTTVEWVNTDLGVAQVETAIPAAVAASAAATDWDSGLLSTGERYRQTFGQEGSFNYLNGEDPSSQATIIVRQSTPQESGTTIFLPAIQQ